MVLIHGNTPIGRKLPFYKVLSGKLSRKGFYVLALDLLGYGGSENVSSLEQIWNFKEIDAAIDYLHSLENINQDEIFLIGHSRGGAPAIEIGISNSIVKKIVAIGPPRRMKERILSDGAKDREYFWNRALQNSSKYTISKYLNGTLLNVGYRCHPKEILKNTSLISPVMAISLSSL